MQRKEGGFATAVLHLWHPENDRGNESRNLERLQARIAAREIRSAAGVDRYAVQSG